jgi:hypothetical protein
MISRTLLRISLAILAALRRFLQSESRIFALLGAPAFQPLLVWIRQRKSVGSLPEGQPGLSSLSKIPLGSTGIRRQKSAGSRPSARHQQGKLR